MILFVNGNRIMIAEESPFIPIR